MTKSNGILPPRRAWTAQDDKIIRTEYPDGNTAEIAKRLGRTIGSVCTHAREIGVKKSQAFLQKGAAQLSVAGKATRYRKGNVPWSAGKKGATTGGKETQFKKHNLPHNHKPVGATRIHAGYLQRKVADTRDMQTDWKFVHLLLWEEHNGPVPKGHVVVFKDGNRDNITIDNLQLITRRELMKRNSIVRFPPQLRSVINMQSKLKRAINETGE